MFFSYKNLERISLLTSMNPCLQSYSFRDYTNQLIADYYPILVLI